MQKYQNYSSSAKIPHFFSYFCQRMRKAVNIVLMVMLLIACSQPKNDEAKSLLSKIETLYEKGLYSAALDSIELLRAHHPRAIEERKKALVIWQNASLKMAQEDIGLTDSALRATSIAVEHETNIYKRNRLSVRRDSLQARYEALCGVVRMIHLKMKKEK